MERWTDGPGPGSGSVSYTLPWYLFLLRMHLRLTFDSLYPILTPCPTVEVASYFEPWTTLSPLLGLMSFLMSCPKVQFKKNSIQRQSAVCRIACSTPEEGCGGEKRENQNRPSAGNFFLS